MAFSTEELRKDVARWCSESRTHYDGHFKKVDEYVKRYEAKRSIAGLVLGDDPQKSPKNTPWDNASDIGIPIEAFTVEGLLPRFLKVCYGAKPVVWVTGETEEYFEDAPIVQDALNFQISKKMKIYRRMKLCFKNVVMSGDGIAKCVWEEEKKITNRVAYYIINPLTNEISKDEHGNEIEVGNDDEVPSVNPQTGQPQIKIKKILSEVKKTYDGPKLYSRNVKQILIPKDADIAEINELDWIADQYERNLDWIKKRIGNIEEGLFDEQAVLELEKDIINTTYGNDKFNPGTKKITISEWHGGYDVNDDGLEEEIVVFLGSKDGLLTSESIKTSKLLGWMITPYPSRPFFHYQIIPRDGSFYGIGVPEFLVGIRNLIDATFNQMVDRGSISNNPPTITPSDHDPDENPFGPGANWTSDNPNAYRVLELPKSEQLEFTKMEFLLALVQKLFGVTDYSLGTESTIASNRTASGIMTIVGEGNIKFDDFIRALQDVNEDLYDFIVQLNSELLDDEFVYLVTGEQTNPFRKILKKQWSGNFIYEAAGNSININREIEQNRATLAYTTAMNSYGKNPAITPEVMIKLTENFFRAIDLRNVKLPSSKELQQQRIHEMAQAILQSEQLKKQQSLGGQGGATTGPGGQVVQSANPGLPALVGGQPT